MIKQFLKEAKTLLYPQRKQFTLALIAMSLYGATDGIIPFLLRKVLDDIFGGQNKEMLYVIPGLLIVFAIVRGALGFTQQYLSASVGIAVVEDLRNKIHLRLLELSPKFFEDRESGDLMSRVTNDTLQVRVAITDALTSIVRDSIRVVALLCTAFYLDSSLALIAAVVFPLGVVPVIKFGKKIRKLSRTGQNQFGGLSSLLHESLIGNKVVRSFQLESQMQARFAKENYSLGQTLKRAERYGAMSGPTNEVLASFAMSGVILYGGMSVMSGVRTQGDFIAFIMALFLLYDPIKKLGRVNTIFQTGIAAAERIFEITNAKIEVEDNGFSTFPQDNFSIRFNDVSFRYGETLNWTLSKISFEASPGQMVAIVGSSGGGKTTLAHLLPRFYDPQQGEILIGGINIKELTLQELRKNVSLVSQHTFLFNDSVHQNILYGNLAATKEEVVNAAKLAFADDFITKFPVGYDTIVGESGLRLSGGERARIAIARAILKNAPILILDEATAALDNESEKIVQSALDNLMKERTSLVIAHRLSTVRKADKILVMSAGEIVESGTHESLYERKGEYFRLCNAALSNDHTDESCLVL
jgi:subfamily B ATP-binding cassette protein MsbA